MKFIFLIIFSLFLSTAGVAETPVNIKILNFNQTFSNKKLSDVIKQLSEVFGWSKVIWKSRSDYYIEGDFTITGQSFVSIIQELLESYPLEAYLYEKNKIVVIREEKLDEI